MSASVHHCSLSNRGKTIIFENNNHCEKTKVNINFMQYFLKLDALNPLQAKPAVNRKNKN